MPDGSNGIIRWIFPVKYRVGQDSLPEGEVRRFYENDQLSVAVHSENDWKLKSDNMR